MNRIDAILGLFFILFSLIGLIFIVPHQTISFGYDDGLSPAFFPNAILGVIGALSILLVAVNFRKLRNNKQRRVFDSGGFNNLIRVCLITFGSCLGLYYLGFLVVSLLVISATMLLMGERNWRLMLMVGIGCPLVIYLVFAVVLKKPLPVGILFS
ncbi:MAG: tripartite tricarboxylate transporter TctB family protein [Deltaproteobacteria bacterium]|nr:tripartite tricarboxylate transporter TctB family protein [Deltaproteobacteria bacterium]